MQIEKIREGELFLLESVRSFDFLRKLGYEGTGFNVYGKYYMVKFENNKINISITIINEDYLTDVIIEKISVFKGFKINVLKDYFETDNNQLSVNYLSKFIQKELMEIIS